LTEPETVPAEAEGWPFGITAEGEEAIMSVGQDRLGKLSGMIVIGLVRTGWPR
jgi:hypothetical protein